MEPLEHSDVAPCFEVLHASVQLHAAMLQWSDPPRCWPEHAAKEALDRLGAGLVDVLGKVCAAYAHRDAAYALMARKGQALSRAAFLAWAPRVFDVPWAS